MNIFVLMVFGSVLQLGSCLDLTEMKRQENGEGT
jgi:hypothetical protein